jgi:hypothetical protein
MLVKVAMDTTTRKVNVAFYTAMGSTKITLPHLAQFRISASSQN